MPPSPPVDNGTARVTHSGAKYGPFCADLAHPASCPYIYGEYITNPDDHGFLLNITADTTRIDEIYFRARLSAPIVDFEVD